MATRVANEVDQNDYYRFHRAFTFGMQEYVEARTFLYYIVNHALMSPDQIESEIKEVCEMKEKPPLSLDLSDYLLGVADLTGELMRQGVSDSNSSGQIAIFLAEIEASLGSLSDKHQLDVKELHFKLQVLKRSVSKVERTCYDVAIQDAELLLRQ
ncbi:Translin [Gracilaria domingensis]|nr:Translin [Gracilaria domingensis]